VFLYWAIYVYIDTTDFPIKTNNNGPIRIENSFPKDFWCRSQFRLYSYLAWLFLEIAIKGARTNAYFVRFIRDTQWHESDILVSPCAVMNFCSTIKALYVALVGPPVLPHPSYDMQTALCGFVCLVTRCGTALTSQRQHRLMSLRSCELLSRLIYHCVFGAVRLGRSWRFSLHAIVCILRYSLIVGSMRHRIC
jgi:hypothetical protein